MDSDSATVAERDSAGLLLSGESASVVSSGTGRLPASEAGVY
jgi:hypothetical protein